MVIEELESRLSAFPRLELGGYPTPLEFLPRLSEEVGRPVWVKRDDEIGPGLGGNKTRKLEYLLAEAVRCNAHKVVTFGGLQSNHARLTAAAAARVGMQAHLFYFERRPERLQGNLLLNQCLGARMHFVPFGAGAPGGDPTRSLEATIRLVRWVSRLMVGRSYFIPVGGHSALGCLGYARAAGELTRQVHALGMQRPWLVMAAGSGGTLAGLMAGMVLLDNPVRLLGIDVGNLWKGFPASIAALAGEACSLLGAPHRFSAREVPLVEHRYVGPCYGQPSEGCRVALRRVARLEGLLLDPVYTAKAFFGMLDILKRGKLGRDEPVIFLHTGGQPALFAFDP